MQFIKLINIYKSYFGGKDVLKDINLLVSEKQVLGIVGRNGEGKTTLLKIIAGEMQVDSGIVSFSPNELKVGYHTQFLDTENIEDITIEEYVLKHFPQLYQVYSRIKILSSEILNTKNDHINNENKEYLEVLLNLQGKFEELGGYDLQNRLDKALVELQLSEFKPDDKVSILSGGQKTRLQLVKVIVQDVDVLLLDEPTNHLDFESIGWLEEYIRHRKGITIIVSHDRKFLDNTVNHIFEIEEGEGKLYFGNYSQYLAQKEILINTALQEIKRNTKKIQELKKLVSQKQSESKSSQKKFERDPFIKKSAGKKAFTAKLYNKRIEEKIKNNTTISPKNFRKMHFALQASNSSGDFVFRTKDFDVIVGTNLLIKDINLEVERGDRIAILGSNGSGKTTFLRYIIEEYQKEIYTNVIFNPNVKLGYYSQEQDTLENEIKVIDEFRRVNPMIEHEAANLLHNMLFTYNQLSQKVSSLSEGEKSKLKLAKLLAGEHNLLILDEPTNHLDIAGKEVLEEALKNYEGTIIVVSHDRYFLEKLKISKSYMIHNKLLKITLM